MCGHGGRPLEWKFQFKIQHAHKKGSETWKLQRLVSLVEYSEYSFILLFFLQFSFFLWTELSLFLLFPFAFVFTSLITHISFSVVANDSSISLIRYTVNIAL